MSQYLSTLGIREFRVLFYHEKGCCKILTAVFTWQRSLSLEGNSHAITVLYWTYDQTDHYKYFRNLLSVEVCTWVWVCHCVCVNIRKPISLLIVSSDFFSTSMKTSPSAESRRAVVSYWRKYVHEVLVNLLRGRC